MPRFYAYFLYFERLKATFYIGNGYICILVKRTEYTVYMN